MQALPPIKGIASMATQHVMAELAASYERQSGQRVVLEVIGGVEALRRIDGGESFDFVVLSAQAVDTLVTAGHLNPNTRIDIARSGVAVAVPAGAPHPRIGSESAVRDVVLAARSIGYSTGPSGRYLMRLFERWGIASIVAPRLVEAPAGVPVGALVARREVELGFQQMSELLHLPGIDVVGALPPDIQEITVFSGAVGAASTRRADAQAFLSFCASPAAGAVKQRHGMES